MIRSFIAIDIPDDVKKKIAEVQSELRESPADVKWVKLGSIHLTLKFLGNIEEGQIKEIGEKMRESARTISPFSIDVTRMGVFPNIRNPRVIWIGLEETGGRLSALQKGIEENLQLLGFEKEQRDFSPHLTIGRVKSSKGKSRLIEILERKKDESFHQSISVREVRLMKSDLKPTGPVYTVLETIALSE
jgi:2'-5' RNA ligase